MYRIFCVLIAVSATASAVEEHGESVYEQTCRPCHGGDGKGVIPGAPDFTDPNGVLSKPDEVLVKNTIEGVRSPGSPMAMPPKGGNPSLSRQDIEAVVRYLRQAFAPTP